MSSFRGSGPAELAHQAGVATRQQLLRLGYSADHVRWQVSAGRWQRIHPGTYATFSGPLPPMTRIWAGYLVAGQGAVLSGWTALHLAGLRSVPAGRPVEVAVPSARTPRPYPGVVIRRSRRLDGDPLVMGSPRRLPVEAAVLDVTDRMPLPAEVVGLVLAVVGDRLTTGDRLRAALDGVSRHRHRTLVHDVLDDIQLRVRSPLERRFRRDVERAHGLPRGRYNEREFAPSGEVRYRDVRYQPPRAGARLVLVELDGREAHPLHRAFRDRLRDNAATVGGAATLRYGWHEVAGDPCGVAAEVAAVLRLAGHHLRAAPCSPGCLADPRDRG